LTLSIKTALLGEQKGEQDFCGDLLTGSAEMLYRTAFYQMAEEKNGGNRISIY
jgi:hypothetical protein